VIVADCANHRVQVLRYVDGTHIRTIGSGGSALGQFNRIYGVAIDRAGCIFAADCLNHRIQVLH
jgi:tripartite motif-containing protein 2/3/tripartite motif-containing protein 71